MHLTLFKHHKRERHPSGDFPASWEYHVEGLQPKPGEASADLLNKMLDDGLLPQGGRVSSGYLSFSFGGRSFTRPSIFYSRRLGRHELELS